MALSRLRLWGQCLPVIEAGGDRQLRPAHAAELATVVAGEVHGARVSTSARSCWLPAPGDRRQQQHQERSFPIDPGSCPPSGAPDPRSPWSHH
jgi:hypothetical protein